MEQRGIRAQVIAHASNQGLAMAELDSLQLWLHGQASNGTRREYMAKVAGVHNPDHCRQGCKPREVLWQRRDSMHVRQAQMLQLNQGMKVWQNLQASTLSSSRTPQEAMLELQA